MKKVVGFLSVAAMVMSFGVSSYGFSRPTPPSFRHTPTPTVRPTPTPKATPTPKPTVTPTATPKATPTPQVISLIDLSTPYMGTGADASWGINNYAFTAAAIQIQANAVASFYHPSGVIINAFNGTTTGWPWYVLNQCTILAKAGCDTVATNWASVHYNAAASCLAGVTSTYVGPVGCTSVNNDDNFFWITRGGEHEIAEMLGDPQDLDNGQAGGTEIVDTVAADFGMATGPVTVNADESYNNFTFSYTVGATGPFTDFLLPESQWSTIGYEDFLHCIDAPGFTGKSGPGCPLT